MRVPANGEIEYTVAKRMTILESSAIFTVETGYGAVMGNKVQVLVIGDKIKIKNSNNFDIDVTEV